MAEVKMNKLRGAILLAASGPNGVSEDRWTHDKTGEIALRYLSTQKCLDRRIVDAHKRFQYRIFGFSEIRVDESHNTVVSP